MNTGKVVLSIAASMAVGALLGILFAPDKGSNTRRKIASKGKEYADDVKEKYNDIVDGVAEKFESLKHGAENLQSRGKDELANMQKSNA